MSSTSSEDESESDYEDFEDGPDDDDDEDYMDEFNDSYIDTDGRRRRRCKDLSFVWYMTLAPISFCVLSKGSYLKISYGTVLSGPWQEALQKVSYVN